MNWRSKIVLHLIIMQWFISIFYTEWNAVQTIGDRINDYASMEFQLPIEWILDFCHLFCSHKISIKNHYRSIEMDINNTEATEKFEVICTHLAFIKFRK